MNAHETVTGLVSREVDSGDSDRYLVLLTAEAGKVECFAKGIRSQKSKLAASAGMLTFGEFKLFASRDRRILISAKAIERFPAIGLDIGRYAYATHLLDIARDVIQEAQPFPEELQTLLNSLFALAYKDTPPQLVARVFELRTLTLAGFAPVLDRCSVCGEPAATGGPAAIGGPDVAAMPAAIGRPDVAAMPAANVGPAATARRYAFDTCGSGIVCDICRPGIAYGGAYDGAYDGAPDPRPHAPPPHAPSPHAPRPHAPPSSAPPPHAPPPVPVSPGTLRAMRHVVACGAGEIFSFAVSEAVADELSLIIPAYLRSQLGRDYPRLAEAERYSAFEEEARYIASRLGPL